MLEARRIAANVIHGLHGRRRAGAGESFWQYRRFVSGEPSQNVDWRRSARDDHLYVREQEWEASHTVWLWPDRSPSMAFASKQARDSKLERGLIVTFALAELLVAGGERVGIPGLMNPTASRSVIDKMAQAMLHDDAARLSLPPSFVPSALAEIVVLSDFWSPIPEIRTMLAGLSASGAHGTLVQIVDPAEETFPYSGRIEFVEPEGGSVITAGRAEKWAEDYVARVALHRDRNSRRDQQARLAVLDPHHQPLGGRTAAVPACGHDGEQGKRARRDRQSGATGMIAGLPLAFAQPLLLLGLLSLPVLWWLLRVMPPRPRRIEFPPTRLLFDIAPKEETPSRTPWWLTALRLAAAALVILAAAGPIWNPQTGVAGSSAPLVILLDDGWSAAASWDSRIKAADELIANADNDRRGVALVPLSEPARDITLMPAGTARVALRQLAPKPYSIERVETLPAIERFLKATGDAEIAWLSDGVDTGRGPEFIEALGKTIGDRSLTVFEGGTAPAAGAGRGRKCRGQDDGEGAARRAAAASPPASCARSTRRVRRSARPATALRRRIARPRRRSIFRSSCATTSPGLKYAGERSAGAVQLLDKRWRRRAIGIVSGATNDTAQPLLASTFYLTRALAPFADVRLGDRGAPQQAITQFLDQKLPMIVLADVGTLSPEIRERISAWIEQGGVLVRFAGPRLAQADDDLVPVKLRRGGRSLGGSLTWEKPQHLASFAADGPFAGLVVPKDITVNRQVLAEPNAALATKSWASLEDGTPLVTGEHRGKGVVSLFHVSADMRWSDLPMSGSFVEMLRRIVDVSGYTSTPGAGVAGEASVETVAPLRTLDGFGAFGPPPSTAKPLPADFRDRATPDHPPGFYGPADGPLAVNALAAADRIAPLDTASLRAQRASYTNAEPRDLRGILLASSLALFLIDAVIVAVLGAGIAALLRRRAAPAALAFALALSTIVATPWPARADTHGRVRHQGGLANPVGLRRHRQRRRRFHRQGGHGRADPVSGAAHRAGSRRSRRHRSGARRTGVLPADLLAGVAGRCEAAAGRHQPHRRLHEAGRHRAVRHPRRHRGAAGSQRRIADAGHAGVARHSLLARRSRTRAGAARARADQDLLSAARLSRPLQLRRDLGRDLAARRRRRGRLEAGPRRRRRLADHHHLERSGRRLGACVRTASRCCR